MKSFWLLMLGVLCLLDLTNGDDDNDDDRKYYNQFTVCDESAILVEDISLMCDSPGTYYYGSNKYRNSGSCQAGDKAKLQVVIEIQEELEIDPYFTLFVKGYGSVNSEEIYTSQSLCSVETLVGNNGEVCPEVGFYTITEHFYWGEQSDNYEYSFSPKVTLGFASEQYKQVYDLGGANTQQCSGNTFQNWTEGVRRSAANTVRTFFMTFGILLGSVLAIFGAAWCIMRQASAKPSAAVVDDQADESNEYHKIAMIGNQKNNLVDF